MQLKRTLAMSTLSVAALTGAALTTMPSAATAAGTAASATTSSSTSTHGKGYVARAAAHLDPLNNSGAKGRAMVRYP